MECEGPEETALDGPGEASSSLDITIISDGEIARC